MGKAREARSQYEKAWESSIGDSVVVACDATMLQTAPFQPRNCALHGNSTLTIDVSPHSTPKPPTTQIIPVLSLRLDSILPHWKMHLLLIVLLGHQPGLLLAQPPPDRPRLFRPQIQRQVLLLPVEQPQLGSLVRVDHGQDFGDGFAEVVTAA